MYAAVNFNTGPAATYLLKNCSGNCGIDIQKGELQRLTAATEFTYSVAWNSASHDQLMSHSALARDTALQLAHVQELQGQGDT